MKKILIILLCFCSYSLLAQQRVIHGNVLDAKTGESVVGAYIFGEKSAAGSISNAYGFYSVTFPADEVVFCCSMLGYELFKDTLPQTNNGTVTIRLNPIDYKLQDVVVYAPYQNHAGFHHLSASQIKRLPTMGGEPDLMKTLQFLPGVMSGNDGANNLSVRGGSQWQNLVLLDEAVVYNPNHSLSFFSVFNSDAVKQVDLYKAYIPLAYGGRLSSVMDIHMNEGNNKQLGIKGGVGLLASRLMVEGPIVKEKISFMVSGRYGYPGEVANFLSNIETIGNDIQQLNGADIGFYDINAKVNAILNNKNRLFISFYNSKDRFKSAAFIDDYLMNWGNTTGTLRWNSTFNDKLNVNTTFCMSNYFYDYTQLADGQNYKWKSDMQSYALRNDWDYYFSNRVRIKSGINIEYFTTKPGEIDKATESSNILPYVMESRQSLETVIYSELQLTMNPLWRIIGGIRLAGNYSYANTLLKEKLYLNSEPRFELQFVPDKTTTYSLSGIVTTQNMHLLSNSSIGIPSDIWVPANEKLKPSSAYQISAGYKKQLSNNQYTFSAEGYYKNMQNIVDYKDNANIFMNNKIEEQLEKGWADSYGIEFYLSKNHGPLTGWVSYTLSKATNHIKTVNNGKGYAPVYDRPHDLKLFGTYQISSKWWTSSTLTLRSGMNVTMPISHYVYQGSAFYEYTERNGYRAPMFRQLDIAFTYRPEIKNRWQSEWVFGVMNVLNRKNVFSMYAGRDRLLLGKSGAYKMYLHGIMPSISYNFKF
ncbi:MAG TPA: carboxypeptidase-like regulatory domain-containing protein [Macellibacteroides fermentans]|uniref:TonB-dependent receptor n=2 Tax=Macellibacteroides fermentans TaxID=879969 RepID=UPI002B5ED81D|nr:carboxypeptidase-like regulatory domain-containing protein [Macellibacteroides fermentans]